MVSFGLEHRGIIARPDVDEFVIALSEMPLTVDAAYDSVAMPGLYEVARRYGLKIYDAAYLELALRSGLPLATRDEALSPSAAEAAGATLFKP